MEFPDGAIKEYGANVIAENILRTVDTDGHHCTNVQDIIDHKRYGSAVKMEDKFIISRNGQRKVRQTTKGWSFLSGFGDLEHNF